MAFCYVIALAVLGKYFFTKFIKVKVQKQKPLDLLVYSKNIHTIIFVSESQIIGFGLKMITIFIHKTRITSQKNNE